jgi:hypothetical protein
MTTSLTTGLSHSLREQIRRRVGGALDGMKQLLGILPRQWCLGVLRLVLQLSIILLNRNLQRSAVPTTAIRRSPRPLVWEEKGACRRS